MEMVMSRPSSSSSSTKIERKVIEKNRRLHMKTLFSDLNSLLPSTATSKEALSLPDQVDEAVDYIKSLEKRLKKSREEKEKLLSKKRSYCEAIAATTAAPSMKSPHIEIREMGSALEITLITGLGSEFIFYEMIRLLHEDGVDVVNANFSVVGNSNFHVIHAQIGEYGFEAAILTERLCAFINGFSSEVELEPEELWGFEFHPEMWEILN
ncbi:transcription factor bHLH162-like [Tripterygium wilfordii]|uniref:transcription factor bHLH162-like n=1 Tax=Tripterygium wilfordii TaxID=458696 RepID=UPI0018F8433D|nr:transcription factor bHLH162-like [Tripterygium wilfordii]